METDSKIVKRAEKELKVAFTTMSNVLMEIY